MSPARFSSSPLAALVASWAGRSLSGGLAVVLGATLLTGTAVAAPAPETAAAAARVDKGPGPGWQVGQGYERDDALLKAAAAVKQTGPVDPDPVEVEEARTRTTRTELDPISGEFLTELSGGSLNYQDAAGAWQPIVTDLEAVPAAEGEGWVNGANRFTAQFPETLADGPVTVTDAQVENRWVSLELVADAPAPVAPTPSAAPTSAPSPSSPAPSASSPAPTPSTSAGALARTAPARSLSALTAPAAEAAEGVVDGAEVTYEDAIATGVDVAYEAGADSVKETIVLDTPAAAAATTSYVFTLDAGAGLTPLERDDVITIQDSKGAAVFEIPAPFMDDAKGAHSSDVAVDLVATGDAWTITVAPDQAWLAAPERAYPVLVDPTIGYPTPMLGCSVRSAAPTAAACSSATIPVSWIGTGAQERALLRFDGLFDAIPADAAITRGQLKVHVASAATPASSVDVRELTQPFTNAATWNTRNGSTAWTTAGGDRASLVSARGTLTPNGTYQNLEVGELISRWVEGTSPYNGFSLEKTGPNQSSELLSIGSPAGGNAPSLYVEWQYRTGDRKGNTSVINESLTDKASLSVNPATGNAQISVNEFDIAGVGLDLAVSHTTNSLSTAFLSPLGYGWTTSNGGIGGASLDVQPYGVGYFDGAGTSWFFHKAIDGTYVRPMGLDVDLAAAGAGADFTVTDRGSKVVQRFTSIGGSTYGLKSVTDRNANAITYNYDASATHPWSSTKILRSVTDTRGRTITITNPGYWNTAATDSANRTAAYTVTGNELKDYIDPAGGKYAYVYDAAHRVTQVTTPEGNVTKLTYDTIGRITKIVRLNAGASVSPTWEFTYTSFTRTGGVPATTTSVKDPNGNTTTYTSDGRGRTGKVVDARGKTRSATYSPNDDNLTTTGATAGTAGGGALSTSTNTYNTGSFTLATTRMPTGAGTANTYGTGARLYDVTSSTDARGLSTTYTYNTAGETSAVTRGGTSTTYLYQGDNDQAYGGFVNCGPVVNGQRTATKTGVLCEERDALYVNGATAVQAAAHRTAYRYDTAGQLTTLIPAGTIEDGSQTSTGRGLQRYTYDSLSRLTKVVDGKGQATTYDYDKLDRQFYVHYNDRSTESSYFTGDGPLRSVAEYNPAGARTRYTEYGRDALMRLQHIDAPEGFTDLEWDPAGRLNNLTDSAGTTQYGYNAANQLTSLAEPGGTCTGQTFTNPGAASTKCTLFNNDDDGRRIATRYPGGATQTWTLDDAGRTTRTVGTAGGSAKLDMAYTYTDATLPSSTNNPTKDTGLIQSITEATASKKTAYSYDNLDRLTIANTTPAAGGATTDYEAFCYDGAGNRTKYYTAAGANCSTTNPANTYSYDAANQMSAATGAGLTGSGFSYDGNGNQTTAKSTIGRTTTYSDRDAAVNVVPTGGSAASSSYASTGNASRLTTGTTSFQSTPLAPAPSRSTTGITTTWTVRDPQGAIIAIRQGATSSPSAATSYYPFVDQVGSTRFLITGAGAVAANYNYSAYGLLRSTAGSLSQPYQFGAGITDSTTGLIKLGLRYLDPAAGRFTQVDPTGQEVHDYLYVTADPVLLNDPNGDLAPLVVAGALAARAAAPAVGRAAMGIVKAPSFRNTGATRSPSREVAESRARSEAATGGARCSYRAECSAGGHVHADYYNNRGQILQTTHYPY